MLATLTDYQPTVTLIKNSGIQFLDFALTLHQNDEQLTRFVRKSANGPLLRLHADPISGKYLLQEAGMPAEIAKPEVSYTLTQSLALLDKVWLPLPFFRFAPPRALIGGPENWARVQILALEQPDAEGNTHRITLVFDTQVYADDHEYALLAPTENDIQTGIGFSLAYENHELADFLDATWVDGWLREVFIEQVKHKEQRNGREIQKALREFEYQGHYLNILQLLGQQLSMPEIKMATETLQDPTVNVDLILDVGNSHTCGVLVEDHQDEQDGLKQTYELQLRDLSQPHCLYNELFDSRVEFSRLSLGKDNFSVESGRENAFMWPSLLRVGSEASRLALRRLGTEGTTGISSPRRYLWDEEPYTAGWRFNPGRNNKQPELPASALPLAHLINDDGEPLYQLVAEDRLPVFAAHYSRSALMTLMLCELLSQAMMHMNSVAQRLRMPHSHAPRQLRHIILTLPSAMPKPEREIFRRRMQEAIVLVWKSYGWHPKDADCSIAPAHIGSIPMPDVQMEWDEATCGQMVYLYNETQLHFGGDPRAFFANMARPNAASGDTPSLRLASIDIGGGTTDLAITQYSLDESVSNHVKIIPNLLFREGFKVAGDDILLDIIQLYLLPAIQTALKKAGISAPDALMSRLFGNEGRRDSHSALRQQTTLQLFIPAGCAILAAYENFDPLDIGAEIDASLGSLLSSVPTPQLISYLNNEIQRELTPDAAAFNLLEIPVIVSLSKLHSEFLSPKMKITQSLRSLTEVVALYDCDALLLTGRPSRFPGIQALFRHLQPLPNNRILSLDGYHTNDWYPFSKRGKIDNPKSTAVVGAMLCLLALDMRLPGFYFKTGDFQPYSTIRYLGQLNNEQVLTTENVYYQDIDLDCATFTLDQHQSFPLRGSLTLGFRQLDNERWPASPLYTLSIVDQDLARYVARNHGLRIRLKLEKGEQGTPERFTLANACLEDGTDVPLHQLRLTLNTLSAHGSGIAHYWIDSGSVFKK